MSSFVIIKIRLLCLSQCSETRLYLLLLGLAVAVVAIITDYNIATRRAVVTVSMNSSHLEKTERQRSFGVCGFHFADRVLSLLPKSGFTKTLTTCRPLPKNFRRRPDKLWARREEEFLGSSKRLRLLYSCSRKGSAFQFIPPVLSLLLTIMIGYMHSPSILFHSF